jgi:CRP-like cAMP-binding protein
VKEVQVENRNQNQISKACLSALRHKIERFVVLPDEEWLEFASKLKKTRISRNGFLFQQGDRIDKIYFVCEGLVHVFYLNERGEEINRSFFLENEFFTSELSFYSSLPSEIGAQALEDAELLYFSRATIESFYERHQCWERLGRLIAEQNYIRKEIKEMRASQLTPEERYLEISKNDFAIMERMPLYHLASYLHITPETLSRIRRKHSLETS